MGIQHDAREVMAAPKMGSKKVWTGGNGESVDKWPSLPVSRVDKWSVGRVSLPLFYTSGF
jgi:hypothetical protein